jgi:hypothetical protein
MWWILGALLFWWLFDKKWYKEKGQRVIGIRKLKARVPQYYRV